MMRIPFVLCAVMVAPTLCSAQPVATPVRGPIDVSAIHIGVEEVSFFRITAADYGSMYRLDFGKIGVLSDAYSVNAVRPLARDGRFVVNEFYALQLPVGSHHYWDTAAPPESWELSLDCGVIIDHSAGHVIFGCPLGLAARASRSPESNMAAWFFQRLENLTLRGESVRHTPPGEAQIERWLKSVRDAVPDAGCEAKGRLWDVLRNTRDPSSSGCVSMFVRSRVDAALRSVREQRLHKAGD